METNSKAQISLNRMAGFAKRLMTIAQSLPANAALAIISIVKDILNVSFFFISAALATLTEYSLATHQDTAAAR